MIITLKLPEPHEVRGYIRTNKHTHVMVHLPTNIRTPWAVFLLYDNGVCVSGDYCAIEADAKFYLLTRSGWLPAPGRHVDPVNQPETIPDLSAGLD